MKPYQFVPPLSDMNPKTSFLPFVLVRVGAVPPAHTIEPPQVTERGVPSAVNISTNEPALFVAGGLFIVKVVMFAFKATSNTLPLIRFRVNVPAEIVGELNLSS